MAPNDILFATSACVSKKEVKRGGEKYDLTFPRPLSPKEEKKGRRRGKGEGRLEDASSYFISSCCVA